MLVVLLAGCLEPAATQCEDGTVCPADKRCFPGGCAVQEQFDACGGLPDATSCMYLGTVGRCVGGVCLGNQCGNGHVDPGEACDDGNVASGDGCRADCSKVERCGDSLLDDGEACDDGNKNPADGCDECSLTAWAVNPLIGAGVTAVQYAMSPVAIARDRNGNVYVATSDYRIVRIDVAGRVTPFAGNGVHGASGDGGPALSATLGDVAQLAVDGFGNVYFADPSSNTVRKIDTDGIISRVSGRVAACCFFDGDGGAAINAALALPQGVAVDGLGQVYISDTVNNRVRRIDTSGMIMTIAGTATGGFSGDGGNAAQAQLDHPRDLALDAAGNLYIWDANNWRIRKITPAGIITTVAGNGTLQPAADGAVATSSSVAAEYSFSVAADGTIYFGELTRVRKVGTDGKLATIAGQAQAGFAGDGGPATAALLGAATDVVGDASAGLLFIDRDNHRLRAIASTGTITTAAGTGDAGYTGFGAAATTVSGGASLGGGAVSDGAGTVYAAASTRILRIDPAGVASVFAGSESAGDSGDGGPASAARFTALATVLLDPQGNLYVADYGADRVRKIAPSGVVSTVVGTGVAGFSGDNGPATSAQLNNPVDIARDTAGNLFIADLTNGRVRKVSTAGTITTVAGGGTSTAENVAATSASLTPNAVAVDSAGNLYIVERNSHRVRRVDANGIIKTFAGTGSPGFSGDGGPATSATLWEPTSVAVDASGAIVICDLQNRRIRKVAGGTMSTLAGNGVYGRNGDGGPAATASLFFPQHVSADSGGYIIDDFGDVRRIGADGRILTLLGDIDPHGTGPIGRAVLAEPRALAVTPLGTLFAGGVVGVVQLATQTWLSTVAGRYPQVSSTGALARFRDSTFGTVAGIAYDATTQRIFITVDDGVQAVSVTNPTDYTSWTIASYAGGAAGFADGAAGSARFRRPAGLYLDPTSRILYVADTGNHVIRAIDLASSVVSTVAGTPATLGDYGDGGAATSAALYAPEAVTRCGADLFIADTGNHRVRRVSGGVITTVLGDGVPGTSGEGAPAVLFPVKSPRGLACDALGNLYVTSTTAVRLLPATLPPNDMMGVVDGTGPVLTIYGAAPRTTFPANVTSCLSGIAVVDATTVQVTDSCAGLLVELKRGPKT